MRSRAVRAALALAALALAAAGGCSDLVSSLTPFGVGDRKPDQSQVAYSGLWEGTTSSGGQVSFQVAGGAVFNRSIQHVTASCISTFTQAEEESTPIDGDSFTQDNAIDPQGRIVVKGTFLTTESLSGSYAFEGRASSSLGCPTSGSGGFTATKVRAP